MLKMDMQNVIYRYFAESARFFKKIQHSIRSGEAELTVISDGEEPEPDDLKAAFDEYLVTLKRFCSWRAQERYRVEKKFKEVLRPTAVWKLCACLLLGGMVGHFSGGISRSPSVLTAGTTSGAVIMALIGYGFGLKSHARKFRGVIDAWEKLGEFESQLCSFLESLPQEVQSQSFREALASAQEARGQLDWFLRQLELRALIFDPSTRAPRCSGP